MATKKEKRAAALARREAFLAEEAELGRLAIEQAKAERHEKNLKSWEKGHEKHYKFVDECLHCTAIKQEQARQTAASAVAKLAAASGERLSQARKETIDLSRCPKAEIEGVDVFHPFAQKVDA